MAQYGFPLIDGQTATADEVADVEQQLGVTLPARYKSFMMRYGGGMFGFVDLFPVASLGGNDDDILSVNNREFPNREFIAVAPVGTGDHWGFPVTEGRCHPFVPSRTSQAIDGKTIHGQDFVLTVDTLVG